MGILEEFKDIPYPRYIRKKSKNKHNGAHYFLAKQVLKLIFKKHVMICNQRVKSEVFGTKHAKTIEPETKHTNNKNSVWNHSDE